MYRYGLGTCYLRMSKIRMAEYHYRKAAEIHPNNAVLLGCVGMVRTSYILHSRLRPLHQLFNHGSVFLPPS